MELGWLQQQFNAVTDVKSAHPHLDQNLIFQESPADLSVQTWFGTVLYVHLLHQAPGVRQLRGILKENSRNGIGTLFMAHATLLPAPSKTVTITDWQDALRTLTDGWVYTFTDEQTVEQVHFQPTPIAEQFTCWHFTEFHVEHVSIRRREIHLGNLKGVWFLGDIVSPAYKRKINYERVNQRYHYSTRTTPAANTALPTDKLYQYYTMLGLERTASEKEVKSAFRRMAMNVHPDVSALPREIAEQRIKDLLEAYEFIKEYHGWH
jgi:hypothetical protein